MLDGTTDTNSDIKIWGYNFTSLTYLHVIWNKSCINSSSWCTNSAILLSKNGGKIIENLEIFSILHSSSTTNDELSWGEFCHLWLRYLILNPLTFSSNLWRSFLNWNRIWGSSKWYFLKVSCSYCDKLDLVAWSDCTHSIASIDWSDKLSSVILFWS